MVTLALIEETHAHGPVAKTTLGVVLVADVVVIILFTIAYSLTQSALTGGGGAAGGFELALRLGREVGGSLLAGGAIGGPCWLVALSVASWPSTFAM
jgi:Kef-type K+ transport system membrane component KefB